MLEWVHVRTGLKDLNTKKRRDSRCHTSIHVFSGNWETEKSYVAPSGKELEALQPDYLERLLFDILSWRCTKNMTTLLKHGELGSLSWAVGCWVLTSQENLVSNSSKNIWKKRIFRDRETKGYSRTAPWYQPSWLKNNGRVQGWVPEFLKKQKAWRTW